MSGSSHSWASSSGQFSEAAKVETLRVAGTGCWACGTLEPEICHVVPECDPQCELWEKASLFKFNYKNTQNSIPLCGACHSQFDKFLDPGYVFFPADIQYFIDFELRDRSRRGQIARDTQVPFASLARLVPSSEEYKQHELNMNRIPHTAAGGRYSRVFLKRYLLHGQIPGVIEDFLSSPKPWHGAPLASFRRAFAALGSPRFFMTIDVDTRRMLEQLRALYFSDEDGISDEQAVLRNVYRPRVQTDQERHTDHDQDANNDPGLAKDKQPKNEDLDFTNTSPSTQQDRGHDEWVLGPDMTTDEVVERFGPVFGSA